MSDSPAAHPSTSSHAHHRHRPLVAPLGPRSPEEAHRPSTPLELFFDLVIVVAVAQAASGLHHAVAEGHAAAGVLTYSMVFFGVWWAWVNFTWFASAYDNDDVAYRLLILVQLTGALVFAAGIPRFEHGDLTVGVLGYVIMRLALVTQWVRASRADPPRRACTKRYALGVFLLQLAWIGILVVPPRFGVAAFWTLAAGELLVPAWAERTCPTTWHPGHIAERYGLFTLITLGESILAASMALRTATDAGAQALALAPTVAGGLLIVFAFWWLYFEIPGEAILKGSRSGFAWGYGHYFVFAAAAAVGAGLAVSVDHTSGRAHISSAAAGAAVAVPVAVYLVCIRLLHPRAEKASLPERLLPAAVVAAVLLTPLTSQPVLATGLLMAGLTAFKVAKAARPEGRLSSTG